MRILEASASSTLANIRDWRSAFQDVVDSIKDIEQFLTDPESHEGDVDYLQGIFNRIEILKSSIDLKPEQKALCSKVDAIVEQLSGCRF